MLKKILSNVKEFKRDSILAPLFIVFETLFETIIPLLMANIIDVGIANSDMPYIIQTGLIMIVLAILTMLSGIIAVRCSVRASTGLSRNLRKSIFEKIQKFSFSNIDKFSTAGLVTRLTTDITNIQNAYMMSLRLLVKAPIMLIFAMIVSFYINAKISLVFIGAVIILGGGLALIMAKAFPSFRKVFKRYDALNGSVQENLSGIRTVKAYVREDFEINKFKEESGTLKKFFMKAEKIVAFNNPLMQFVMYVCIILISWFGASMVIGGNMTTGQLMSLFNYQASILMSLMLLSMVFIMIILSKASGDRIAEVLDEEINLHNPENPIFEIKDGSIEFKDVDFAYGSDSESMALAGLNINIESGMTVGILGGTGSGKSSFVQLIPRLYDVVNGTVKVGGIDVREYDIKTLRSEVAMVLQKNVLFSGTVRDNLKWGNQEATDEEIVKACQYAMADEFIEKLPEKYDSVVDRGGTNFSGGQKQRLCIARALVKKPRILILDDSTSAVDTQTDAKIRKAFKEVIPETTKIIIAQRISSVQDSDLIIVLDEGKINGVGTHEELLKSNLIYREVYESQTKGDDEDEKSA